MSPSSTSGGTRTRRTTCSFAAIGPSNGRVGRFAGGAMDRVQEGIMMLSPGTVGDVTRLGAAEIAHRVASGELSARDVVEACISHIERVNGRLNALAVPLFEQARAAAAAADAARDRGDALGPLHGVPVTIKEMFDIVGTATTAGLTRRA